VEFNVNALSETLSNLGDVYTREMFMYDMVVNFKIDDLSLRDSIDEWVNENHDRIGNDNFAGAMAILAVMSWAADDRSLTKQYSIVALSSESSLGALVFQAYCHKLPFDVFKLIIIKAGEDHKIGAVSDRGVQ
jgi:hypothetical protein